MEVSAAENPIVKLATGEKIQPLSEMTSSEESPRKCEKVDEIPLDDDSSSDDLGIRKRIGNLTADSMDQSGLENTETISLSMADKSDEKVTKIISPENHESDGGDLIAVASQIKANGGVGIVGPLSQLPKPEAPPGLSSSNGDIFYQRSHSSPENMTIDMPAIGKFIRERSNSVSAAIAKKLTSLKDGNSNVNGTDAAAYLKGKINTGVTEFNLTGMKVIVQKTDETERPGSRDHHQLKGRISFFSRSSCRDCTAVRRFFRERGLKYVEINIDVFPQREKELVERTGSSSVPTIFFNEKLFGGLVALNSLRNSGDDQFDQRLKELLGCKCPDDAPAPPVYGFDDPEEEDSRSTDEMLGIVGVLRQRLPIHDRLMKMKIVKNCFSGSEMVEALIQQLDCGRKKAIGIGKQLAKKHFINHVFGENEFEDGNHFYRFLEHESFIPRCFNFRGSTNDKEPMPAALVGLRLAKIMSAILESYASEDRQHVDYLAISNSEEFRRYVNLIQELHRVDLLQLTADEKLALFLNLYNAMVIHTVIRYGCAQGVINRRSFFTEFQYLIGGFPYSLHTIKNGILRNNRRPPFSFTKPLAGGDARLELAFAKVNPLIHFGLCNGSRSSPPVRFFTPQGAEAELRCAAREFFQNGGMDVNLDRRVVVLSGIIKEYKADFGQDKEILKWIISFLDPTKAGLLMHLLNDGGPINVVYQYYDWSVNC